MKRVQNLYKQGTKRSQFVLSLILAVILVLTGLVLWTLFSSRRTQVAEPMASDSQQQDIQPSDISVDVPVEMQDEDIDAELSEKVQSVVDVWIKSLKSDSQASVVITNDSGAELATYNPDQTYFAASLYKLFVAYEGYRMIDDGKFQSDEQYLGDSSRLQCLDLMIRNSDSPCGEKMLLELGSDSLVNSLQAYDIKQTKFDQLQTTASDSAKILQRIGSDTGLSKSSQMALLASMEGQIYLDGLKSGFSKETRVYDKVGFNEYAEYHDIAIVEKSGKRYIIAVLTVNVGTRRINTLAAALDSVLFQ